MPNLLDFIDLDPQAPSGLCWIQKPSKRVMVGDHAGTFHKNGYYRVIFRGKTYRCKTLVAQLTALKAEKHTNRLVHR